MRQRDRADRDGHRLCTDDTVRLGVTAVRRSVAATGVRQWIGALVTAVMCGAAWWIGTYTGALNEVALLAIALLALTAFTHRF